MPHESSVIPRPAFFPRTIRANRPRTVRWWPVKIVIIFFIAIGVRLLGLVPITVAWASFGTDQEGRVLSTYTSRSHGRTFFHADYSYQFQGRRYADTTTTSFTWYDALDARRTSSRPAAFMTIPVRIVSVGSFHYAGVVEPGTSPWRAVAWAACMALWFNGIISIFVYLCWIAPWRIRQLYRYGTPAPARIVGHSKRSGKGGRTYHLEYEFEPAPGTTHRAEMQVTKLDHDTTVIGQSVTVLHYPGRSRPSTIYEFGGYECLA
jgi:hypothetical protein